MSKKQQDGKLSICHFGHKRIPSREGGIEIVVEQLAVRMARLGHNVVCYNRAGHHVSGKEYNGVELKEYDGVTLKKVWTMDKRGMAALTSSMSAGFRAAFGRYDVVHIHAEGPCAVCFLPKLMGKRVICTIHGLDWQRAKWGRFASWYIKFGERQAVKHADEVIVLSKNMQDYFWHTYGRKTQFIPNGVEKAVMEEPNEILKKYGLKKDEYVLFLGRIVPEKGLDYLIEAWKKIRTDKKLVVVGGSSDTDDYQKRLFASSGENVLFTGFVQGKMLRELYSNAYLYCMPSDLEGMPLSLLEAMSFGNCCLVSNIPECADVVEDHGVIFKKSDVADLTAKLQHLLDQPQEVAKYKSGAASFISRKYNWDDIVEKTLNLYKGEER